MLLTIHSIEYREPFAAEVLQSLLYSMPEEIRERVGKYKRWQDAYGCLLGKYLLRMALQEEGYTGDLKELKYSAYGRPYLENGPDFNIAHSGHRVVCIVSRRGRIGIDLEEIRDLDINDFKDQFSIKEWEIITKAAEPIKTFYYYWTAKECLSKADGRGLSLPLTDLLENRRWNLYPFTFFEQYASHIAAEGGDYRFLIKEYTFEIVKNKLLNTLITIIK